MEDVLKNFYLKFYNKTGGYIPTRLLKETIHPGDFFQIKRGELILLGNIYLDNLVHQTECHLSQGNQLNAALWNLTDGVTKPYSGRSTGQSAKGEEFEFSKQILAFKEYGSFIFRGNKPESTKIKNWNDIQQHLIIKFTQTVYSFREVYVATEVVTLADWTLAVAGTDHAELEIAIDKENFGLVDIFGHLSAKNIQSKDIEFYDHSNKRKPCFFKAKRITVQEEKLETFINDLIRRRLDQDEWASSFFEYEFTRDHNVTHHFPDQAHDSMLDMLHQNELHPNTALLYFRWSETTLADVFKLFNNYAEY